MSSCNNQLMKVCINMTYEITYTDGNGFMFCRHLFNSFYDAERHVEAVKRRLTNKDVEIRIQKSTKEIHDPS